MCQNHISRITGTKNSNQKINKKCLKFSFSIYFSRGVKFTNKLPLNIRKNNVNITIAINNKVISLFLILNKKDETKKPKKEAVGYVHKAQDFPPKGIKLRWEKLKNSEAAIETTPKIIPTKMKPEKFKYFFIKL
ncbi:MAG: hypothetical protein PHO56_05175 [Patescibacteria group bacterium]|nr:hypothetical protein [Patescibacteria group bacterium]